MPSPTALLLTVALLTVAGAGASAQQPADYTPAQWPRVTPMVEVVRSVGPAVVNIYQELVSEQTLPFPLNRFGASRQRSTSLGSGVIIDPEGFILTNAHVIQPGGDIQVQLADGTSEVARLVNLDSANDVALLKIRAERPLPTAHLGTSSDIMVGETVIAIGNPLGNSNSVTSGIVSSVFRDVRLPDSTGERFRDFIQLDAPINPGNSGGPLLNVQGEVIGINAAIAREAEGIGFAIPIDRVRRSLVDTLLNPQLHKNVVTGLELASDERGRDVSLARVHSGSPAEQSGLRAGDRLVSVGSTQVDWVFDVAKAFYRAEPGDEVEVRVRRGGELITAQMRLDEQPSALQYISDALGLRVVDHPSYFGVLVESVEPSGPAARLPLRRGDLIDGLAGRAVDSVQDLYLALRRHSGGQRVDLNLFRGRQALRGPITVR